MCDYQFNQCQKSLKNTFLIPAGADIYMLFTGWEVCTGKIFCRGLKNGPRPKAEGRFLDRDKIFFNTDRPKR